MIVIDLFSGAGGLSEGFHKEGYKIVAHVEKELWACETIKTRLFYHFLKEKNDLELYYEYLRVSNNYKNLDQYREIVYKRYPELRQKIEMEVLNKKFGNPQNDPTATSSTQMIELITNSLRYSKESQVDLIIGGPPCQAYSLVGRSRMKENAEKDSRNYLFQYYKRIVEEFKPRAFIFENVPGLLTAKKGNVYKEIEESFDNIGYNVLLGKDEDNKKNVIDFADFGVPQRRKRVLLFGFRKDLGYSYPNFDKYKFSWECPMVTENIISDLPYLVPNEGKDLEVVEYSNTNNEHQFSAYAVKMREESIGVMNHRARTLKEQDAEIYTIAIKKAAIGEQLKYNDLPKRLKTHKNEKAFLDRFKVHWWGNLPHTVVAHISKDGHYNIHPDVQQCRSLTVREAARIQSFPDNYKFEGPRTAQYVQVGNAVPPIMSEVIAKAVKETLLNDKR
ncbi:DNA cytosine methyltransferase [Bacillus sp. WL1]|uniref:DNA cytosine methyltransferase n=1 Tax=Bacillus sp. WL1 TaxID=2822693 RepID=UPI001B320E20|nr:DNA cytosine methyltransferase [Bacillus sp. WL1]MBP3972223.1 DNA cytosine methyltransferase [Bacillus sp. WL1]